MGTTLDEPLYYVTSMHILARTSLRFDTNLHTYPEPVKFLASLPGRSFCIDIDNSALRYYFRSILLFYYFILFIQVLVTWSLLLLCVVSERLICVHAKTASR